MEGFPQNTPRVEKLEHEENKIEKPTIKEGVDSVFEQHPELLTIGTKEQYQEYLDGIFPESKIKDIVYHQTTSKDFDVKDWKLSKLGGAYFNFYNSEAMNPQWKKALGKYLLDFGRESRTVTAVVDVRNPFVINKKNYQEIERKIGLATQDITKLRKNFDLSEYDSVLGFANPLFDKGELDDLSNHTIPSNKKTPIELALFEPNSQVHVVGSKEDIESFENFVKVHDSPASTTSSE